MIRPKELRQSRAKTYTHAEVCALIGLSYNGLKLARERGDLPFRFIKVGSSYRYPKPQVDDWVAGKLEPVRAEGKKG